MDIAGLLAKARDALFGRIVHKYTIAGQLLGYISGTCEGYCALVCYRFGFLTGENERQGVLTPNLIPKLVEYIDTWNQQHPDQLIRDVIFSGGDTLVMKTSVLKRYVDAVGEVLARHNAPGTATIRFGTKELAFYPFRITEDPTLIKMLEDAQNNFGINIYVMTHFTHPAEITKEARKAAKLLKMAGCNLYNQTPVVDGVNADRTILIKLLEDLAGVSSPYYFFNERDTGDIDKLGWRRHALPIVAQHRLLDDVFRSVRGALIPRHVMSTQQGKIEIVGRIGISELKDSFFGYISPSYLEKMLPSLNIESILFLRVHRDPRDRNGMNSDSTLLVVASDGTEHWITDFMPTEVNQTGKVIFDPGNVLVSSEQQWCASAA